MSFYSHFYEKEGPGVQKDAPKPKGIRAFFMIIAREWKPLIGLNLLFLLHCIPLVTIGASLGALSTVTLCMVRDQPCSVVADFREAFGENFKRYSVAGFLGVGGMALLAAALCVYFSFSLASSFFLAPFMLAAVLALIFGLSWNFVLPLVSVTELPLRVVLKNSVRLGLGCLRYSLPALLCELVIAAICLLFFPIAWIFMMLGAFSALSLIGSFAGWAGIRRYVAQDEGACENGD